MNTYLWSSKSTLLPTKKRRTLALVLELTSSSHILILLKLSALSLIDDRVTQWYHNRESRLLSLNRTISPCFWRNPVQPSILEHIHTVSQIYSFIFCLFRRTMSFCRNSKPIVSLYSALNCSWTNFMRRQLLPVPRMIDWINLSCPPESLWIEWSIGRNPNNCFQCLS